MIDERDPTGNKAELRRQAEAVIQQVVALKPENLEALSPEEIRKALHDLRVHQVELEMQNEELRRAQKELDVARARYFDLYDLAPAGYVSLSEHGVILEANLTAASMLGVSKSVMVTQSITRFVRKEDQHDFYKLRKLLLETRTQQACDLRMVKADGTTFWAHLDATLNDSEGRLVFLVTTSDITERKRAEDALRTLSRVVEQTPVSVLITDREGNIEYVNSGFETATGYTMAEVLGKNPRILKSDRTPPDVYSSLWQTISAGGNWHGELCNRRRSGELFWESATISGLLDDHGQVTHYIAVKKDITARRQAETDKATLGAQLQQSQKMESVGRLAGGVAHDFNNMLAVILSNVEMAIEQMDPALPLHGDLKEIQHAALRAANLTRQLLAFAREQTVAPKVLDLNDTVAGMLKLLVRLIGEDISLNWQPNANIWPVKVDPSQIDQILVNLCVNARDAISSVGKLTVATGTATFDEGNCTDHAEAVPGEYVRLSVTDDGCGMTKETLAHIFEPFFTTKGVGEGTGLGLATVYGIVKQNGGFIDVRSELGAGSTFTIYLPRHVGKAELAGSSVAAPPALCGNETILLVEDEPAILKATTRMLERMGYTVLEANTPGVAVRLAQAYGGEIHMLLTDVVMPEMNGRDLAKNLLSLYPGLKHLFMSGYTADVIAHQGVLDEGVNFIQKPFSKQDLAAKVREVLDGAQAN